MPPRDKRNGSLDGDGGKLDHGLHAECGKGLLAQVTSSIRDEQLRQALEHMLIALQLLDDADAPMEIGAHLDYAISRMRDDIPGSIPDLQ